MHRPPLSLYVALYLVLPFSGFSFESSPSLSITNSQGQFILAWPLSATNWVLERATDLASGYWFRVPTASYQSNAMARYVATSGVDSGGFYRLRKLSPPLSGVAGHWRLDEGAGQSSEDDSGLQSAMSFTNTTWAPGRIGPAALWFNGGTATGGSRAWLNNSGHRLLPVSGQPFSLSLWFNPDALATGWRALAGNNANGTNGWHVALHTPGSGTNYLVFGAAGPSGSLSVTGRTLLLPSQWHELTLTYNGTEGSIYMDSQLLGRAAGSLSTHDGPIYFGGGLANYDSFWGRVDEIRLYTNCLTHEEISRTGLWRFDENGGGFTADRSIKGHHGTLTHLMGWVPGREGSGVGLNSSQVVIPNVDQTVLPGTGGSFSLSFWLRPNSLADGKTGLMSCGAGTNNGWQLALDIAGPAATVHFAATNGGGTLDFSAPVPLTNNVWTKLDLTYNGGIATLFANGRKVRARNGAIQGSRAPLVVGSVPGLPTFDGVMDDLQIYGRERHPAEIGPVATTMWETVLLNSATNITLQGAGPAGKPLFYSVVPIVAQTNGIVAHSAGAPVVTYAAGGRKGPDAFAYTVSDGEFTSEPAIVALSVVRPHWLSPTGGSFEPLDGTSPEQAWTADSAMALDAIWKTNNFYDCFFYAPGNYSTRGWKYLERPTANIGCKHIGSGSSGVARTAIKLVDTWESFSEGVIFSIPYGGAVCHGFEVHNMVLDCDGDNNPQQVQGEPIWLRIPLTATARVDTVTLRWPGGEPTYPQHGRAQEFRLCTRVSAGSTYVTNCVPFTSTGNVDILPVSTITDELILHLDRRAAGVDFYSLSEIEVSGGELSVPRARTPTGERSQLDSPYPIVRAVDQNPGTSWASGPEDEVEIVLPLAPQTLVSQITFQWNCKTLEDNRRLGPAADYQIRARDAAGQYFDVPFIRSARTADGLQINRFGTVEFTNVIVTDQLVIRLVEKAPLVDSYSLREVSLHHGSQLVPLRLPAARNSLNGNYEILRAFDGDPDTQWSSATQGMLAALSTCGNNMKFTRLKIIGFGNRAGRECFPMTIFPFTGQSDPVRFGNILVEDCIFTQPAMTNRDVVTVLVMTSNPPDTYTNAVVRRCTVTGLEPHFPNVQAFTATHVENCLVENCRTAVYFEPDPGATDDPGPVLIRSNRFINVNFGVFVNSYPNTPFDSVTFLGNEIVLNGAAGWALAACDPCSPGLPAVITNLTALNNIVRYPDWAPRSFSQDGGFLFTDIHHAVIGNNVIGLGTSSSLRVRACPRLVFPPPPREDCDGNITPSGEIIFLPCLDRLPAGYRRALFNNRDLSAGLLPIRFFNGLADGLASQQQWPE